MPLIFSYGSLQLEDLQRSLFGRLLQGQKDELVGFELSSVGDYANVKFNGKTDSRVTGIIFDITDAELAAADKYELEDAYKRMPATLASGKQAWVYVYAREAEA